MLRRTLGVHLYVIVTCLFALTELGCRNSAGDYLAKGNAAMAAGKYDEASLNYRKAIQKDPKSGEAHYRLGLARFKQQNAPAGYRSLTAASQLSPDNDEITLTLANVCLDFYISDKGRPNQLYVQTTELAQRLLTKNPNSFEGLRLMGMLTLMDGKLKEAIQLFERANASKPMQPELIMVLAQALFEDHRFPEGEKLALELIQKQPSFTAIYEVLYKQYMTAQRSGDAENILKTAVRNNPSEAAASLRLAGHYAQAGKLIEMNGALQRLIDNPKGFPAGRMQVGDFYERIGKWDEAARNFDEGAKSNPKERIAYEKRIARVLLANGKLDEAARKVEEILAQQPKDAEMLTLKAGFALQSGAPERLDEAIRIYEPLVKQRTDNADLPLYLGQAYIAKKDYGAARLQLLESINRRREFVAPRILLAEIGLQEQKPGDTVTYATQALAYDPRNPRAKLLRSVGLTGTGKYDEAERELKDLLSQAPQYRDAQLELGLLALARGKAKEAESIFKRLQQPGQQADQRVVIGLAEAYASEHQLDAALELLGAELKKAPGSTVIRQTLADTAVRAGKYDLALEHYKTMLSANPNSPEVYLRLGETQQRKGDLPAAIGAFQSAILLSPHDPTAAIDLATALQTAGRAAEAKSQYERAMKLQPDNPLVMNNMAYLIAETGGNLDEALKLAQRAAQKAPNEPGISDTLGWIYLKKNLNESAFQIFSNLVKKYPGNATFRFHLAMTFAQKGDKEKARAELESALTKNPAKDDERRIRELLARIG